MFKVVLINPKLKNWSPNVYVPLGITYIASVLEQEGYSVEIIDLNVENIKDEDILEKVDNSNIVGITGMITEYREVLRLVNIIKKFNREIKIVLGGPLATTIPRELLQISQADIVVLGEGEKTIAELISRIKTGDNLASIKGIAYKDDNHIDISGPADPIIDIDTIPFPARHLLYMDKYLGNHFKSFGFRSKEFDNIKSTNLISSRGCPYNCTFCFKEMWGHKWRGRRPANIVEEMKLLNREYGVNGFLFNDDTFVLDRKRVFEFCQLLKALNMGLIWYCNGRVNLMTKELLKTMHDAGCLGICYGIESGNQQILNSMKKNIKLDNIREVVKWTKEAGIHVSGYFMIGMLDETKASIEETFVFAKELELDYYGFSLTTPIIGTELFNVALERGQTDRDKIDGMGEWSLHINANLTRNCSYSDLRGYENRAFKEFYINKRFGKHYFLNPYFWKETAKVLISVRNKEQLTELVNKAKGIISS